MSGPSAHSPRAGSAVARLARRARLATWAIDIAFWLVYGGVVALMVYTVYVASR